MYRVQNATQKNLPRVIQLINKVFLPYWPSSARMEEKFPIFLSEANLNHIFIATDRGKPVSHAAFYRSEILIQGFPIQIGSIGSVCTDAQYRGQGIASRILDVLEAQARDEGVEVLLISGERSLYLRRQCKQVGGFKEFTLRGGQMAGTTPDQGFEMQEYALACFEEITKIYNQEPVRFYRSLEEFEILFKAGLLPFIISKNKAFVLKVDGRALAYFVISIAQEEPLWGEVVEYAGERQLLGAAFDLAIRQEALERLLVKVPCCDPLTAYLAHTTSAVESIHQLGTVKIINLMSLMESLRPYFLQYLPPEILNSLRWEERDGLYYLLEGEEAGEIGDLSNLAQLVFGFAGKNACLEEFLIFLGSHPIANQFVQTVLPVPLPWAGNLNFI